MLVLKYAVLGCNYVGNVRNNEMKNPQALKEVIKANGSRWLTVEFRKKDGSLRKLNGHVRAVPGHDGINPTAHIPKYITLVLSEKDAQGRPQWRNVNLETVERISIAGKTYKF